LAHRALTSDDLDHRHVAFVAKQVVTANAQLFPDAGLDLLVERFTRPGSSANDLAARTICAEAAAQLPLDRTTLFAERVLAADVPDDARTLVLTKVMEARAGNDVLPLLMVL